MTDQAEVKIVGDASSAVAAVGQAGNATQDAAALMKTSLANAASSVRESMASIGGAADRGAAEVSQAARETTSAADRMHKAAHKVSTGFTTMGSVMTGLVAGATLSLVGSLSQLPGALIGAAKAGLDFAGSLGETAQALGVGTTFLQEFRYAATQNGASTGAADAAIGKFTLTMGKAFAGGKSATEAFTKLHINMKELAAASDSQRFEMVAEAISKLDGAASRSAAAVAIFGKGAKAIIPTLEAGAAGFRMQAEEAHKFGLILSAEQIQNADKTADKIDRLTQALKVRVAGVIADNASAIGNLVEKLAQLATTALRAGQAYQGFLNIQAQKGTLAALWAAGDLKPGADQRMIDAGSPKGNRDTARANLIEVSKRRDSLIASGGGQFRADADRQLAAATKRLFDAQKAYRISITPAKPVSTKLPGGNDDTVTAPRASGGGGSSKSAPKGASGPSAMDSWSTELSDGLLAEEKAGNDLLAYTVRFWQQKLALTKAASKEQLTVRRNLAQAELAMAKAASTEEVASLKQMETLKSDAAKADNDLSRLNLQEKLQNIDQELQAGTISANKAATMQALVNKQICELDVDLERKLFAIKSQNLRDTLKIGNLTVQARRDINRQLEVLEKQHDQRMAVMTKQNDIKSKADENKRFADTKAKINGLVGSWAQALGRMATFQASFSQTIKSLWGSLTGLIGNVLGEIITKMVVQWLTAHGVMRAISALFGVAEVTSSAGKAGAAAYASTAAIPIVGPAAAPAAAATAVAATLAFAPMASAMDGWDVPSGAGAGIDGRGGMPATIHPREMVLPADIADRFRAGGGGGGDTFNIQALDANSLKRLIMQNGSHIADSLKKTLRDGKRP